MNTIGSRMKFIRKREGLKQVDFAKRVLVSASYISKVESDKETPSDIFTKLVSLEFGVSYMWLKDGIGNIEVNEKEHDYFERNVTNDFDISKDIKELNTNLQILLQKNSTFRKMCISQICYDLSSILKINLSDSQEDLVIEILADYIGTIEEFATKINSIKSLNDYLEISTYYKSSYLKHIEKLFHDFSNLLTESEK